LCSQATVFITVKPTNGGIVANPDQNATPQNIGVTGNVLPNDRDLNGGFLTVSTTLNTLPSNGTVFISTNGDYTYIPKTDFVGVDSFYYQVCNNGTPIFCTVSKVTIIVNPKEPDIIIYDGISPNGDNKNDTWVIDGITKFPNNEVQIFNRWGNLVFSAKGYDNNLVVWKGDSNQGLILGDRELPSGTYYYVIDLGNGTAAKGGFVVLNR
ncbi:MAG: gliding motility-associated C-terminal domain-containing protein, partial [Bacteroidetes bacterium]